MSEPKLDISEVTNFLFEIGTMRKENRAHRQLLLTDDLSDNTSAHSYRVIVIGYFLARMEGADCHKVMMMCMIHDTGESRTNDHNWLHKRYVSVDEAQILDEQLGRFPELAAIALEYERRESLESIVAKDADSLDQILLLREYAHQGNREAQIWLDGKEDPRPYAYVDRLKTGSAKILGRSLYDSSPSDWWKGLATSERRK